MAFVQTMTVRADSGERLRELLEGWDRDQRGVAPGYVGARLLADSDAVDRYVIEVDFASESQAVENNARAETQAWAEQLRAVVRGQPEYRNHEVAYPSG